MSPKRWREIFNKPFSTLSIWADGDLGGGGGGSRPKAHFIPSFPSGEAEAHGGREP